MPEKPKREKVKGSGRKQKYGEPSINVNIKLPFTRSHQALKDVNEALDKYRDPDYKRLNT